MQKINDEQLSVYHHITHDPIESDAQHKFPNIMNTNDETYAHILFLSMTSIEAFFMRKNEVQYTFEKILPCQDRSL